MLLDAFFRRLVRAGELTVVDALGRSRTYTGARPLARAAIRLADRRLEREILLDPQLAVPEAYVDGRLVVEEGDLRDFLEICAVGAEEGLPRLSGWSVARHARFLARRVQQFHTFGRAKANVARHYDLSGALYALFLDEEREYTCAYFETGAEDIGTAQRAKERHVAAKLLLRPGHTVLDMGCGWGALALHLAADCRADVTGVTLSEEQHRWANARAAERGLADRARFRLQDYRAVQGRFDRVVSIGMMEHVGLNHYGTMFRKIRELLADDGVALVHSIGRKDGPSANHPWLTKHIFPGSYAPALSEVIPAIERQGLWITDVEILRLHYAHTLRRWRERFLANRDQVAALYDERFCRMWDVYLTATELFFSRSGGFIFQIQLAKDRHAVPLTRDYIREWEDARRPTAAQAKAAE
jgi:cyclopropane-fatty-acyl-phospholipid synthase